MSGERKKEAVRMGVQMAVALIVTALFVILNVNAGPLSQIDLMGGWEVRRMYLLAAGAALAAVFACAVLQRLRLGRYLALMALLLAGAVMRFYALDAMSPYYAENLAPIIRAVKAGDLTGGVYTPLTLFVLRLFAKTGVYPLYMIKLTCITCDLLLALALYRLMDRTGGSDKALPAALAYLFCPVFFMYGAYAGTMDSVYALLLVLSALALQAGRGGLCAALFGAAYALNPISIIAAPLLLLYGTGVTRRQALVAPCVCAALSVPGLSAGVPLGDALLSLTLRGRNVEALHVRSCSFYNFFGPVYVKDMPSYHVLEHARGIRGEQIINEAYVLSDLLALRVAFFIAFAALMCAVLVWALRRRETLRQCRAAAGAFFLLLFVMLLPGVDAACFIVADIGMLLYALRVRGGWRVAALSLGASAISACAFMTGAEVFPLWTCMAAQTAALCLLAREIAATLQKQGAMGTPCAAERI